MLVLLKEASMYRVTLIVFGAMIYVPSFMKISSAIEIISVLPPITAVI
jgi:hypothetical protein